MGIRKVVGCGYKIPHFDKKSHPFPDGKPHCCNAPVHADNNTGMKARFNGQRLYYAFVFLAVANCLSISLKMVR